MKTLYFCFSPFIKLSRYLQGYINQYLELFLAKIFQAFIRWCLHHRYAVLSYFTGIAILIFTLIPTGAVKLTFFPAPEQDNAQIPYEFEQGMSVTEVQSITGHKTLQMLSTYTQHEAETLAIKLKK